MQIQQSYRDMEGKGCLYLVPTPIGNLQDMTYRAVEILKSADIIAAEDTRHTKKLCHAFSIETPLISYHEHNKLERENMLVDKAKGGEVIALVSDAGMPAISDPGADLGAGSRQKRYLLLLFQAQMRPDSSCRLGSAYRIFHLCRISRPQEERT